MINETYTTEDIIVNVFNYSHDNWHKVRAECLLEKNWLRENYLPRQCKVEDHEIFYIAYTHDRDPINFGGIMKHSDNVARVLNRMYTFPKFRSVKNLVHNLDLLANTIIPVCESNLENPFPLNFISMQMRDKVYKGEQRWWKHWKENWLSVSNGWKSVNGLVQVVEGENSECYQNIVYKDSSTYKFKDWNPKTLTFEEFASKFS